MLFLIISASNTITIGTFYFYTNNFFFLKKKILLLNELVK